MSAASENRSANRAENQAENHAERRVVPVVVGAYPMLPPDDEDCRGAAALYGALADLGWVDGIELPFREALDAPEPWLAEQLAGRFTQCVVTAIPGTMGRTGKDPAFGLASPDDAGRGRALTYIRSLLEAVDRLHQAAGQQVVTRVELHSAPHHQADTEAFHASLSELTEDFASRSLGMIVEHCDAEGGVGPSEKAFLPLSQEIAACRDTPALITVNWGRSVIETHDPDTPESHVRELVEAGRLGGVMISGAGPEETQWAWAWADAHLPLAEHEPTSWLTPERVAATMRAAGSAQAYEGVKINTRADASLEEKLAWVCRVREAMLAGLTEPTD